MHAHYKILSRRIASSIDQDTLDRAGILVETIPNNTRIVGIDLKFQQDFTNIGEYPRSLYFVILKSFFCFAMIYR